MKTILVTGCAGFIGSNLCFKLLEKNRVIGVDNFISGQRQNVDDLKKNSRFVFIRQDITKPLTIKKHLDEIWNLACPASPVDYFHYPIETLMTGSIGVKNVLDLALKKKAKFLHTSTSEIYGEPKEHPQKETYWGHVNPIGPRSCYDEGKRFAESLIENYREKYQLDTKIVRIFNTYGPRMRINDGRVISNFITQSLKGKNLTVYGQGFQTRSFCFVDDLVKGLIKMMVSGEHGPINLGNPEEYSVLKLAKKIIKLTKSKSKIVFLPLPKDDPTRRKPDITLAKKKLVWQPKVSLQKGLLETINYFEEVL
ncbi:NAD-dependent dehydratase [Candidatus Shapirobacteria bacterium CG10_big_fil_rev_8_21_14_0_10_38_14]|uniref:UDP-glucuronate decarboxylase n=1 Tax=Candidatus Shapirobacteria bacterium CG10_big_fil_rev_8_21_14_0_10_38_14 TaxID=1974483 RepID=A0A2M8L556_9BACT|nr:MAG: NAD-dependent dehydratase [Candidatus Shapirobacteria bacterium CG10_big_fil_rev_8_21_14_0_10_38_14]